MGIWRGRAKQGLSRGHLTPLGSASGEHWRAEVILCDRLPCQ